MPGGICKENFNRCLSLSDFMQKLLYYGIEISQTITILLSSDDTLWKKAFDTEWHWKCTYFDKTLWIQKNITWL